jgi:hypothetical protein
MTTSLLLVAVAVGGLGGFAELQQEFLARRASGGRLVLLRAAFDDGFGPDAAALRDGLAALGGRVEYLEAPQRHNLASWPDLMARVLMQSFPGTSR